MSVCFRSLRPCVSVSVRVSVCLWFHVYANVLACRQAFLVCRQAFLEAVGSAAVGEGVRPEPKVRDAMQR
eukprot:5085557-Pleurochrysis_carterae.AAC.2